MEINLNDKIIKKEIDNNQVRMLPINQINFEQAHKEGIEEFRNLIKGKKIR